MQESAFYTDIISNVRKKHGLSQEQLAHLLDVSFSTVNAWESGKRRPQKRMQELILSLANKDKIHLNPKNFDSLFSEIAQPSGLKRSGAGFVSTILNYNGIRDPLDFTHFIGRWYGSLPSFLVRDLVRFLATDFQVDNPVLVNFAGSGTVPLEFSLSGHKCMAIDINPVAVLLTSIKTQVIDVPPDKLFEDTFNKLSQLNYNNNHNYFKHIDNFPNNLLLNPNKWIDNATQESFLKIVSWLNTIANPAMQLFACVSFLNISVDFCQIDKRCTNHYVFRENVFSQEDIFKRLYLEASNVFNAYKNLIVQDHYIIPDVKLGDATKLEFKDNTFAAVFSHPPYGNTINYYAISKVNQSILGLVNLKKNLWETSLGNIFLPWVQQHDVSSGTTERFKTLTSKWIAEAYRVLKTKGILLVIIGDSRYQGGLLHPHTYVIEEAEKQGMVIKELFIWITNHKSGMHVRRKGHHIDHNYIIICEKT